MSELAQKGAPQPVIIPNPLQELHRQAEAEFQPYAQGLEIVSTFGEPQAEYAAVRKGCGMMDLPQRGVLELAGKDRHVFLNNLLTNELWSKQTRQPLPAGRWIYAFLLNLKGRIVADFNVLELGERTLLEMDVRLVEPVRRTLDLYLFAEQVTMTSRVGGMHEIALHGPRALEVVRAALDDVPAEAGTAAAEERSCAIARMLGHDVVMWRDDIAAAPGLHLIVPTNAARSIWMHLLTTYGPSAPHGVLTVEPASGGGHSPAEKAYPRLRPIGWAAFNATRIEAGRPILGIDFEAAPVATAAPAKAQREQSDEQPTAGILAVESGMMPRAVSLTKGCYLGQEIVARMHARQQVARQIVGIRMDDDALPLAGAEVFEESQNQVGIVTSSTISPVLSNAAICLAFVRKPHFAVGSAVHIPAEGKIRRGMVVEVPFVKN